jgi:hypothetical protein
LLLSQSPSPIPSTHLLLHNKPRTPIRTNIQTPRRNQLRLVCTTALVGLVHVHYNKTKQKKSIFRSVIVLSTKTIFLQLTSIVRESQGVVKHLDALVARDVEAVVRLEPDLVGERAGAVGGSEDFDFGFDGFGSGRLRLGGGCGEDGGGAEQGGDDGETPFWFGVLGRWVVGREVGLVL